MATAIEEEEGLDDDVLPGPLDFLELFNYRPPPVSPSSSGSSSSSSRQSRRSSQSNPAGNNSRSSAVDNSTDNMLYSFISDLVLGLGGGQFGNSFPFLAGNLGDYVWGDGLDALVTQLMNNMEGTGPPPLENEKLLKLPDITIQQKHVDEKLQCAVCWDDFHLNENVKILQCDHMYHPDCIIPWLKLHGTCPICRKDLNEDEKEGEKAGSVPHAEGLNGVEGTPNDSSSMCNNFEMEFD